MSILGDTYGLESMSIDLRFELFFIYFVSFYVSRYSCMSILGDTYGIESMSKDSRFELFFYLFRLNK